MIVRVRHLHRWIAMAVTLPFLVVVITGCLLQIKRWVPAIQPASEKGVEGSLASIARPIEWRALLEAVRGVPGASVKEWADIKAIDVRPALGVARARTRNGYEVQVDLASGKVLSAGPRYSSLLIELHEGAYFGALIRNAIFLPAALGMLVVTLTGIWLIWVMYFRKWRNKWSTNKMARPFDSASRPST